MTIAELGAIGEFVGSIAVLVTLLYLAVQIRQNTHHARVQMGHDGWLTTEDHEIALMSRDTAEVLAKVDLGQAPLSATELKTLDAYYRSLLIRMGRVEHTNSLQLEILPVDRTARSFVDLFNSEAGRAWWESNRALIDLLAPVIGARLEELLEEPDCPSRSKSFELFQRKLSTS